MVLPPKPIMPTESVERLQSVTLYTREDRHFQSKPCGTFSLSQYIPHASKTCAETVRPRCCAARSRVPPSNVENAARVGASLHDGPRSRCHSAVRLVWRARSAGLGQRHCPGVAAVEDRILSRGTRRSFLDFLDFRLSSCFLLEKATTSAAIQKAGRRKTSTEPPLMPT